MTTSPEPIVLCACGCGQPVTPKKSWHRQAPRYIHGHSSRDPENKARRAAAIRAHIAAGRPPIPTFICRCGCGEVIPPKPHHRYSPPKYFPGHYQRGEAFRTALRAAHAKRRMRPPPGWVAPSGLCECGCGAPTKIARAHRKDVDQYAGYPERYVHGHNSKGLKGPLNPNWMGGRRKAGGQYTSLWRPDHPAATGTGYVLEHRLVYEETRGITLPKDVLIHHVNGVKTDNRPENLVAFTRVEHGRAHHIANEIIGLFLDDKLLEAAKAHVRQHGTLPDLEALTQQVYGPSAPAAPES